MTKYAQITEYGIVQLSGLTPLQRRMTPAGLRKNGIYAYEDNPPSYDEKYYHLGSTVEFDGTTVTKTYVVLPIDLETFKERKQQELAEARWQAEVSGVDGIRTDRESQSMITGAALKAMQDETYSCRWKTEAGFVELTAPQILAIADAVRAHVQGCFDREAELLELVEAATTPQELEAIVWSMPASS